MSFTRTKVTDFFGDGHEGFQFKGRAKCDFDESAKISL